MLTAAHPLKVAPKQTHMAAHTHLLAALTILALTSTIHSVAFVEPIYSQKWLMGGDDGGGYDVNDQHINTSPSTPTRSFLKTDAPRQVPTPTTTPPRTATSTPT